MKNASISGPYKISGKFLLLPISGSGQSRIIFGINNNHLMKVLQRNPTWNWFTEQKTLKWKLKWRRVLRRRRAKIIWCSRRWLLIWNRRSKIENVESIFVELIGQFVNFRFRVNFENLFNNKELSDNMNAVLNENSDILFQGLQIPIQNVLGDALVKIFSPVNEMLPYSAFFADWTSKIKMTVNDFTVIVTVNDITKRPYFAIFVVSLNSHSHRLHNMVVFSMFLIVVKIKKFRIEIKLAFYTNIHSRLEGVDFFGLCKTTIRA